jgi:hypothetical protein
VCCEAVTSKPPGLHWLDPTLTALGTLSLHWLDPTLTALAPTSFHSHRPQKCATNSRRDKVFGFGLRCCILGPRELRRAGFKAAKHCSRNMLADRKEREVGDEGRGGSSYVIKRCSNAGGNRGGEVNRVCHALTTRRSDRGQRFENISYKVTGQYAQGRRYRTGENE